MLNYIDIKPPSSKLTKVIQKNIKTSYRTLVVIVLSCLCIDTASAAEEEGVYGVTNFAFSSYLGTGFYTTSGQNVFVLHLPFDYTIKEKSDTDAGWGLNLPVTLGFINFDTIDPIEIPNLKNNVRTITLLPGIEYRYPVTPDWTVIPFADYGFARDLDHTNNVLITGVGAKSYADFHHKKNLFTLGNRFLYSRERSGHTSNDSSYSLIETGLNYRMTSDHYFDNGALYANFYYINFYYPNDLVFFERTANPVRVGMEHELGVTISNISDFLFFKKPQLGIGVRFGNNVDVYRIVFGAPF